MSFATSFVCRCCFYFYYFFRSSTYKSLGTEVTVKYTQGSWTGTLSMDVVTIPKGIHGSYIVNVAAIFQSDDFFIKGVKWQGILGLAYDALAKVI